MLANSITTSTKFVHRCRICTKVNKGNQRKTKVHEGKQSWTKVCKDKKRWTKINKVEVCAILKKKFFDSMFSLENDEMTALWP